MEPDAPIPDIDPAHFGNSAGIQRLFPERHWVPLSRGDANFAQAVTSFDNPARRFIGAAMLEKKAPRGAFFSVTNDDRPTAAP
jgi:hypothetical protein